MRNHITTRTAVLSLVVAYLGACAADIATDEEVVGEHASDLRQSAQTAKGASASATHQANNHAAQPRTTQNLAKQHATTQYSKNQHSKSSGTLATAGQSAQAITEYVCCHDEACKAETPPSECDFDAYACSASECWLIQPPDPGAADDFVSKTNSVDPIGVHSSGSLANNGGTSQAAPPGGFPGGTGPWTDPVFQDPSCALRPDWDPCDTFPGGGGGGGGGSGGGGGGHYGEWDCTQCNLEFIACFAGCGAPGFICRGVCVYDYIKCARDKCDDQ